MTRILSVIEALRHAGYVYGADIDIMWVDSENVTDENAAHIFNGKPKVSLSPADSATAASRV